MGAIAKILVVLLGGGAIVYGSMLALAHFVEPEPREITITVPPAKFNKQAN